MIRDKPSFGNIYLIIPSYPPCLISPTVEEFQKSLDIVTIEISNNYFADNYKNIIVIYCSGHKQESDKNIFFFELLLADFYTIKRFI
ncbi:hypothetical protein RIR_jg33101.t1 [Rhizophagus irregularis DAOM 181602=DAOM 197198]|nr:hypothetical protein RIR_jg33101.t1 [Rhizophagus irregularis DAOM 181602=DAOM 197198]